MEKIYRVRKIENTTKKVVDGQFRRASLQKILYYGMVRDVRENLPNLLGHHFDAAGIVHVLVKRMRNWEMRTDTVRWWKRTMVQDYSCTVADAVYPLPGHSESGHTRDRHVRQPSVDPGPFECEETGALIAVPAPVLSSSEVKRVAETNSTDGARDVLLQPR